jgi:hypothetical protein
MDRERRSKEETDKEWLNDRWMDRERWSKEETDKEWLNDRWMDREGITE